MMKRPANNQRGASLIIVIAVLVILGMVIAVLISAVGNESFTAMNQSAGLLSFGIAEGGVEFEQYNLAQNVDWYRSTSDPMPSSTRTLGAAPNSGSFTVQSFLPATELRTRIPNAGSTADINVYTTNRFPAAGLLQIDDDITDGQTEYIRYTGTTANSFTGISRNVTIGTLTGTANPHERRTRVYPVTTLLTALGTLGGVCTPTPAASFNIVAHSKFLTAGMIDIEGEEIGYTGSSITGGTMTLLGVTRCLSGTSASHAINQPVTPLLWDGASPDFLAEVVSTGTVAVTVAGNAVRVIRKTVQR